jgi:hypothetical protein
MSFRRSSRSAQSLWSLSPAKKNVNPTRRDSRTRTTLWRFPFRFVEQLKKQE